MKKFFQIKRAQISLEYLLITAAFFSFLLLFAPIALKTYSIALFGFDVLNAQNFANSFEEEVRELKALENGSEKIIEVKTLNEWIISSEKTLLIELKSAELKKSKQIKRSLSIKAFLPKTFLSKGKNVFVLKKVEGKILVENT